jgi:ABC-2 type transport system permease protein
LIYFFLAFLFYSAIFAAIGSAVDSETDTQQLMFPVTIPLLIGYVIGIMVSSDPGNQIGFWFSYIPFTSSMVMMARLPYGVSNVELAISISILIVSFLGMVWVAGRIYRVGVLMYGKKPSWKELGKWVFYKG